MSKKTHIKELRERDTTAIEHELAAKQRHLFDLRSQAVTEKLENPSQLPRTRREIAQIKTILQQRKAQATGPATAKA